MKCLLLASALCCSTSQAHAFAVEMSSCLAQTKTHTYKAEAVGSDVHVTFSNIDYANWGQVGRNPKYKMKGKITTEMTFENVSVADFINSYAATESLVSAMFSRPEYQGEADMVHYYAGELLSKLECK